MISLVKFINENNQKEINYPFDINWDEPDEIGCKTIKKWLMDNDLMPKTRPSWIKASCKNVKWDVYLWTDYDGITNYCLGYTYEIKKKVNGITKTNHSLSTLLIFYASSIGRHNKSVAIESGSTPGFKAKMEIIQPIVDELNLKFDNKIIGYVMK